jgi:hypothetical protein
MYLHLIPGVRRIHYDEDVNKFMLLDSADALRKLKLSRPNAEYFLVDAHFLNEGPEFGINRSVALTQDDLEQVVSGLTKGLFGYETRGRVNVLRSPDRLYLNVDKTSVSLTAEDALQVLRELEKHSVMIKA